MPAERTLLLDHERIQRKLKRISIQLCEETWTEKELVIVGIAPRGVELAKRLGTSMGKVSNASIELVKLHLDKDDPHTGPVKLSVELGHLKNKTVILVDDVLMSGRTLMHAAAHLVQVKLAKLTTVVLVDRRHRAYPIRADIVGLTLSTTAQEHITVELGRTDAVYIS
ncbi:MAG: phosphoribosyltransferase [Flavobacteriales bacterium]|nr:phosphoribosyltransferase [Flavobacteriales bacterium]MBL0043269.1 phosphoribosyltransferase [Flavobacteriales bacterium]